jgi:hypothetical protein
MARTIHYGPGHHPQYAGRPAVYDSQVVLWNILDAYGSGSILPQNLQMLVDVLHPDFRRDATSEFQCRYKRTRSVWDP